MNTQTTAFSLDEICKHHLALPEHSFGLRQVFERAIAKRRLNPKILVTTNSLELTKTMAATAQVIAFMPALTVISELAAGGLRAIRFRIRTSQPRDQASACTGTGRFHMPHSNFSSSWPRRSTGSRKVSARSRCCLFRTMT
jgi:DNA-binding transcriptional LysR family regulator